MSNSANLYELIGVPIIS